MKNWRKRIAVTLTVVMFVTGLIGSIPTPSNAASSTEVTLDTADSLDGWSSWNTLVLDTADYKRGTASISMTGTEAVQFAKSFPTPLDTQVTVLNGRLNFWYYVDNVSNLVGAEGQIEITSSGGPDVDEMAWGFVAGIKNKLVNGWNYISLPLSEASIHGSPDLTAINFFRIYFFNTHSQAPVLKIDDIVFEQSNPNAVVLDKADSVEGWLSSNPMTLDTQERMENLASISMTGDGSVEFERTFTEPFDSSVSADAGTLNFFYYIDDLAALSGATGSVELGSSGSAMTDGYAWDFADILPELTDGWNLVALRLSEATLAGQPDLSAIDFFRLTVHKSGPVTSKLDTIYFEEQQGLPVEFYEGTSNDTLTLTVTNGTGAGNKYVYQKIGIQDYKFKPGDYIEYDVFLDQDIPGAGGIEIDLLEGFSLRGTGWADQNGLIGHGDADLSDHAYGQWYHRKMKITTPAIGKHIDRLLLVGENDTDGLTYSASYKNIVVTDRLGNLQKALFTDAIHYNAVGVGYSNGIAGSSVTGGAEPEEANPKVMNTVYPNDDVPIASWNVKDYQADDSGAEDATYAFQQALNACSLAGGGVVWAPSGTYKMLGNLVVDAACTLRGDWKKPAENDQTVGGTVLLAYAGRNDEQARPFISLGTAAAVRNLSIYYPEQTITDVRPYPYTIWQATTASGTVMNVTLVNSYNGISVGGKGNSLHYTRDVYGTPLKTGIFLDGVVDVGRIEEVAFSPKYWANSGLAGAPSVTEISGYLQGNNGSAGLLIGRTDWEVLNGILIENYETGIRFVQTGFGVSNGSMYDVNIKGARTGLDIHAISGIGWLVSAGSIEANAGLDPIGVRGRAGFEAASFQFNKTAFSGNGTAVRQEGNGLMSFVNSDFQSWSGSGAAIDVQRGSVGVEGNRFAGAAEGQNHIRLGALVSSASILSNDYNGPASVVNDNPANGQIVVDQTPRVFESIGGEPYVRSVHPLPKKTDRGHFYDVTHPRFDAAADGVTDDTLPIQEALDAAGRAGGGTVYLPAGKYRVNGHLSVPAGVELRGAQDVPFHTFGHGTVIYAYPDGDRGQEEGTPFIELNSSPSKGGSGIRGILIWYPEQSPDNITAYPWAIQSQGPNCWVIYTNVSNAYKGVDFGTYNNNGHVIDYLSGAGLKTGLFVGSTSTEGWVENVHFNPTYWSMPGNLLGAPSGDATNTVWAWQKANGNAFLFGHVANGHVSETFTFGSRDGVRFIEQPGLGSFHGTVLNHGTDGSVYGVRFSEVAEQGVDFINLEAVQFENGSFVVVEDTVSAAAPIRLFNTNHWTEPTVGYDIRGGNLLLQQGHFTGGGTSAVKVTAGTVHIQGSYFAAPMPRLIDNAGGTVSLTGSVAAGGVTVNGTVLQDGNVSR